MVIRNLHIVVLLLCLGCSLSAQIRLDQIKPKYENYQAQSGRHILLLRLNQPEYHLSDTIFFKAYLTEESRQLAGGKHVATARLYGQDGLVEEIKYEIKDGSGVNQLVLPEDMNPGVYKLVSYTNWMKNFDPDYLFQKEIRVSAQKQVEYQQNKILKVAIAGGYLTDGIPNRVVVKTLKPKTTFNLLEDGQLITSGETRDNGIGSIEITPKAGASYQIKIPGKGNEIDLQRSNIGNAMLGMKWSKGEKLNVWIPTVGKSIPAFLVVTNNGRIIHSQEVIANQNPSENMSMFLDLDSSIRGRIGGYLLDKAGNVLSYANTFVEPDEEDSKAITIASTQSKEVVELNSSLLGQNPATSDLHVSVLNQSLFQESTINDLDHELFYFADAPFDIHIDKTEENWREELQDYLTLTAQIPNWSEILYRDTFTKVHAKDNMIRRIAIATDSMGNPLERGSRVMMYFHKEYVRLEGLTGSEGKIRLHFPGIEGESEMYYTAMTRKRRPLKGVNLQWLPEVEPDIALPYASSETDLVSSYGLFAQKRNQINESYRFFGESRDNRSDTAVKRINVLDAFEKNVMVSDETFKTEDYELFPTMKEYLNEVVSPLQVYNSFGRTVIRVKSLRSDMNTDNDPLFIIDGIGTKNIDYVLSLDPKAIEEIRVVRNSDRLNLFSSMGRNGIVLMKSVEGGLREELDENNVIRGINPVSVKFNSSSFSNENTPVFESNVYWLPYWDTSKPLSFIQSNDIGTMALLVEGFIDSKPVSKRYTYESKNKQN